MSSMTTPNITDIFGDIADRFEGLKGDEKAAFDDLEFYSRYVIGAGDPSFRANSQFIKNIYTALQDAVPVSGLADDEEYEEYYDPVDPQQLNTVNDNNVLILGPRDSGKSTAVSIVYHSWIIGKFPLVRIILATASEDKQGLAFSRQLRSIIERNERYHKIFGNLVPARGTVKWSDREWIVSRHEPPGGLKDPTFTVVGLGSNVPSKRADILTVDDIVTQANAYSDVLRQQVERFVLQTLFPIGVPGSIKLIVGARWDERDFYHTIANRWNLKLPDPLPIDLAKIGAV